MLLSAELLTVAEAAQSGFLAEIVSPEDLDTRVQELSGRLAGNAPITMRVTKESIRRLLHAGLPDDADLIRQAYGSEDFRIGVESFVNKKKPEWTGN